jgi:hypothetical protein
MQHILHSSHISRKNFVFGLKYRHFYNNLPPKICDIWRIAKDDELPRSILFLAGPRWQAANCGRATDGKENTG